MTAAEKQTPARPSIAAHEAAVARWKAKVVALGEDLAKAEAELERQESEAAQAALEGKPLPDMGDIASKARALKRARVLAQEAAEHAEEELAVAKREEAEAARLVVAAKVVEEATALDDTLAELGHRLTQLQKLAAKEAQLASAAGLRRRRAISAISGTSLAGTVVHHAPELLEALNCSRCPQDLRQPLAPVLARRFGLPPYLEEVK